jgi:alkylation response protein AidB-like acyl-CoA dehydrogenase
VRAFVRESLERGRFTARCDAWHVGWDPEFTRALAGRGWIGMTIPAEYGGHGRSAVERYVVAEELLAAGAPLAAHWAADRQVGPAILRFGTEEQRTTFLPAIAHGECYFAIGMSEPEAGSDLAAVRTRATRCERGWRLSGAKVWVTGAHRAHVIIVLARTTPLDTTARHSGLTQFLVPTGSAGLTIRPIRALTGAEHFTEVVFDDVFVPDERMLGNVGAGWAQVTAELAMERSGPERFLSTYPLLEHVIQVLRRGRDARHGARVGELLARLAALRRMSLGVAETLEKGLAADIPAALVKDMGTRFESEVIEVARAVLHVEPDPDATDTGARLLGQAVPQSPGFTIRGGTNEILRGVVARGMGPR